MQADYEPSYDSFGTWEDHFPDPDDFEDDRCGCQCGCPAIVTIPSWQGQRCSMCEECCFPVPYEILYSRPRRAWWSFAGWIKHQWRRIVSRLREQFADDGGVPF